MRLWFSSMPYQLRNLLGQFGLKIVVVRCLKVMARFELFEVAKFDLTTAPLLI